MNDQITFKRLTPGQSVPRPPFRDAALVYDVDGDLKLIDGDTGEKKPLSEQVVGVVEANSATPALRVTQTGSGDALLVEDSAHPDSTPLVVNNLGQIISGTTTAFDATSLLQLFSDRNTAPNQNIVMRRAFGTGGASLEFEKAGTGMTPVTVGNSLGAIRAYGYDGSAMVHGSGILFYVTGAVSTNNIPQSITFLTGTNDANITERMRIDNFGNVGIGTNANARAILDLNSTTKGFLPPRMTTTQRDAIAAPIPAGLMVYNTTTNKLNFYNGTAWEAVTSS